MEFATESYATDNSGNYDGTFTSNARTASCVQVRCPYIDDTYAVIHAIPSKSKPPCKGLSV